MFKPLYFLLKKYHRYFIVFLIIFGWLFSSWPQLFSYLTFPPKIYDAQAVETLSNGAFTGGTTGWTLATMTYDATTYYGVNAGSINTYATRRANVSGTATYNTYTSVQNNHKVFLDGVWRNDHAGNGNITFFIEIAEQNNPDTWTTIWTSGAIRASTAWNWISSSGINPGTTGLDVSSYFGTGSYRLRARIQANGGAAARSSESGWLDNISLNLVNTVIGPGASEPSSQTIGPGHALTDLANFTLKTDYPTITDTVTAAVVTLNPAGAYENIAEVAITNTSNVNQCTSVVNPSSNTVTFSSCNISVNDAEATYKIRIQPKSHANMPVPNGAIYATTGLLTGITATNLVSGSDSGSATITVDNLSPANATNTSGTAGDRAVTLNWTTSPGESSTSTILRWVSSSAGAEAPTEGAAYSAGDIIGNATVACVFTNQAAETLLSKTDGLNGDVGCTTTGLTNGQAYSYKIFQQDAYGNYNTGLIFTGSPFTPVGGVQISLDTTGVIDFGAMPLESIKNNSASPEVIRVDSGPADLLVKSTNFTHDANTWTLGSAINDHVVKWEYSLDGNSWSPFLLADNNYSFDVNVATDATRNLHLRINTPTGSVSNGPYGATVTILATTP